MQQLFFHSQQRPKILNQTPYCLKIRETSLAMFWIHTDRIERIVNVVCFDVWMSVQGANDLGRRRPDLPRPSNNLVVVDEWTVPSRYL